MQFLHEKVVRQWVKRLDIQTPFIERREVPGKMAAGDFNSQYLDEWLYDWSSAPLRRLNRWP
jgi:hypothetical protein